jgi:hypothetical protein
MARTARPRAATFIVRMWTENDGDAERTWRGQVEHVQSNKKRYVHEMEQVIEFIEEHFRQQVLDTGESGIR